MQWYVACASVAKNEAANHACSCSHNLMMSGEGTAICTQNTPEHYGVTVESLELRFSTVLCRCGFKSLVTVCAASLRADIVNKTTKM